MRLHEASWIKNEKDEDAEPQLVLEDGRVCIEYDGCDHADSPLRALNRLTKLVKKGQELVEISDGSDTLWFGIVKSRVVRKRKKK